MSRALFDSLPEVGARVSVARHVLLGLDFDGALTGIVDSPDVVFLSGPMRRALMALAGRTNVSVAVVSGRDRASLQACVDVPGLIYAGNRGLEISGPGFLFVEPTAAAHAPALTELAPPLAKKLEYIAGAFVEDKGLTLSVHYRRTTADDREAVRSIVHNVLDSATHPFQLTAGDMVHEIRPHVHWSKGTTINWIKDQLEIPHALVIYLGDDGPSADDFAALPGDITIKVGDASTTRAHYYLQDTNEARKFLEWMEWMTGRLNNQAV
jgi:trehalose 6-phosphate phosphatase